MISVKDRKFNGKIVSKAVGGMTSWKGKLVIRFYGIILPYMLLIITRGNYLKCFLSSKPKILYIYASDKRF